MRTCAATVTAFASVSNGKTVLLFYNHLYLLLKKDTIKNVLFRLCPEHAVYFYCRHTKYPLLERKPLQLVENVLKFSSKIFWGGLWNVRIEALVTYAYLHSLSGSCLLDILREDYQAPHTLLSLSNLSKPWILSTLFIPEPSERSHPG